ncbi:hypothetical protein TSAR_000951 [Trichomalopsis sarcophagae]|uniref:Uncharacterized protein n=1 Tax=Trichomalopsis sarcophagae TaxID=543379 RepID=A0A232EJA1_9HYME|nr:hypothetical protein TSAR_000951 [Trichomalopsis sarcophagae]
MCLSSFDQEISKKPKHVTVARKKKPGKECMHLLNVAIIISGSSSASWELLHTPEGIVYRLRLAT